MITTYGAQRQHLGSINAQVENARNKNQSVESKSPHTLTQSFSKKTKRLFPMKTYLLPASVLDPLAKKSTHAGLLSQSTLIVVKLGHVIYGNALNLLSQTKNFVISIYKVLKNTAG